MTLQEEVNETLDNAVDNGYQEFFRTHSNSEVADDIIDSTGELEAHDRTELEAAIQAWKDKNL